MKLEIKDNGYELREIYKTDTGKETHTWHFDKDGNYIKKVIEKEIYDTGRENKDNKISKFNANQLHSTHYRNVMRRMFGATKANNT